MPKKQKPDTKFEGSWAHQEATRPKVDRLSEHRGKPSILIPGIENAVTVATLPPNIGADYIRIFNG